MSVHVISWVLKNSTASGTDRLLLLVLANYADEHGVAWPSVGRLARETCLSERTIQRTLRDLEEGGHIVRDGLAPDSRIRADHKPNAYRILDSRGDTVVAPYPDDGVTSGASRGDKNGVHGVTTGVTQTSLEQQITTPPTPRRGVRTRNDKNGDRSYEIERNRSCLLCEGTLWVDSKGGGVVPCSSCCPDEHAQAAQTAAASRGLQLVK